jgi:hypothetical protein
MLKPSIDSNISHFWQCIQRDCVILFKAAVVWLFRTLSTNNLETAAACVLPINIDDDEKIVRVIKSTHHLTKDKMTSKVILKPAAFRSQAGTDDVSVIRQTYTGSDFCKAKGKVIAANSYAGLAVISAADIRSTGSTVHDSRIVYLGHAHISHGVIVQPDEPQTSDLNLRLTERCRALCRAALYHPDPEPLVAAWTGPTL